MDGSMEGIENLILIIRGQRVMLDSDLAVLYGSKTKALNQAVKRNAERFPPDFMFQLTSEEVDTIRSQSVTASRRNIRYLPYAFTEHGAIMAANVLNSRQAIEVSVYVVRAFVKLRGFLETNKELAHKLAELERQVGKHDETIHSLVVAIRQLMQPKDEKRRKIGFR